ncbi:MAG: ATP-dependent RNA helicase, partial [Treponema sp.]|nr:ATP-dependent RNA helicase [Treponema sp.]
MNYLDLPVYKNHHVILSALEENQAVVVESPTGSGKTTQLPVILHEAAYSRHGIIGVTQPRRIAAVSVSEFIARQMGTTIPGLIGYKMRFEDRTNHETRIKIMTDGILLQEMKLDPWLSKYSLLVVDEAHERSLNIDFILGLLKRVLENRREFKVIVSSATINTAVFSAYFGDCPVVKIDAQRFPVTLVYDPPDPGSQGPAADHSPRGFSPARDSRNGRGRDGGGSGSGSGGRAGDSAMDAILAKVETIVTRFVEEKRGGDILAFLSGEKMIKECMGRLSGGRVGSSLYLIPLYGRLGKEEQERVFDAAPKGKTKVVLSTNIAETSITIEGITAVIDSGLSKLNWYNPRSFTSSLVEAPVSKASANQRRGRAGRTCEGTCYRLYTRRDFENRPLFTAEEIFRTDLSEVILRMADLGITNFEDFDFISAPGKEGLIAGIETLNLLEALEPDRSLSNIGKMMTEFPLAPRQSRIIVEAIMRYPDVMRETIIAAAFLSTQSPYVLPPGEEIDARKAHHRFRDDRGDFVSYLRLFESYRTAPNKGRFCENSYLDERTMAEIVNVTAQLEEIVASLKIPIPGSSSGNPISLAGSGIDDYLCCIGRGMIQFVCFREGHGRNTSYRSLTADKIIIHPGSVMFRMDPRFIVAGEVVRTSRMYAMSVSPLSREILDRIMPGLFAEERGRKTGQEESESPGKKPVLMKARDFTNNIKIAGEVFEIRTVKGKKTAILPWENFARVRDAASTEAAMSGVRK